MPATPLVCEARLLAWVVHATHPDTASHIRRRMGMLRAQGFHGIELPKKMALFLQPSLPTQVPGWPSPWSSEVVEIHVPPGQGGLVKDWAVAAQKDLQKTLRRSDPEAILLTVYQPQFPHNGACWLSLSKSMSPSPKYFWNEHDELLAQDMGGSLTVSQWKKIWSTPAASLLLIDAVQQNESLRDGLDRVCAVAKREALSKIPLIVRDLANNRSPRL